jgi:hypothetical protein
MGVLAETVSLVFLESKMAVKPKKKQAPKYYRGKKTKETVDALLQAIATGAPYVICCRAVGIHVDTFHGWRQTDPEFETQVEQTAAKAALRLLGKIEEQATNNFSACAWILERRFPELFSRPEIQLNLGAQNGAGAGLTINITAGEAKQLESTAEPIRESVREMFNKYRPALCNDNGNDNGKVVEVEAVTEPETVVEQPISHKEGDENSQAFWHQFCGDGERLVEKDAAVFVVKTIVTEAVGQHRCRRVAFKSEPFTVADVLTMIEKLSGPAGWQHLQRRAGYT